MGRRLSTPTNSDVPRGDLPVTLGGTDAITAAEARTNLSLLAITAIGAANGVASLDSSGKLPSGSLPASMTGGSTLIGTTYGSGRAYVGRVDTYTITNFDINTTYTISVASGTFTRNNAVITYTPPAAPGADSITVNGKVYPITVNAPTVAQPTITSPLGGAVVTDTIFTGSAFTPLGTTDTHDWSVWQVATDAGFTSLIVNVTDTDAAKTKHITSLLSPSTTYYARVKYHGLAYGYSAWSPTITFSTAATLIVASEQAILSASDKTANANFGRSVAISGDGTRAIVGAYQATSGGLNGAGQAYIFLRTGNTWAQEAILSASDKVNSAYFAASLSITNDGSRVILGATGATSGGLSSAGQAYVFLRTGTTWAQEAILSASDKAVFDQFGAGVFISSDGSRAVAGASGATAGGVSGAGQAYVFLRTGTTWAQEAILSASDKTTDARFSAGISMSTDSVRMVIGAYGGLSGGLSGAGQAYVFLRTGTTWAQEAILSASDKTTNAQLGYTSSMSSDGTRVIVGATGAKPGGLSNGGQAYVFLRTGTTWAQEAILLASDKATNANFGQSVSVSSDGSKVIVGSGASSEGITYSGQAYIFLRTGTTWVQDTILSASDKAASAIFGVTVSMSSIGTTMIVGASSATSGGLATAGQAYVFV